MNIIKTVSTIIACMLAFVSIHANGEESTIPDPNFHVYICFGQSNMEGNAQWEAIDNQYVDTRFQMLATTDFDTPKRKMGEWYTAECPIVSPAGKLGPTDYFGRTMVAAMPADVKIGVVAVAMGGSPIEMFDKDKYKAKLSEGRSNGDWWATLADRHYGSNPYGRIIEMAKKAQMSGVIKGILLHQGCSNCGDPNWPNMVKKIYNDMLTDLGLNAADVPLFVGETEREDMGGGCSSHNTVVAKVPSIIPTAHVVSSENIPGNGTDAWHFSAVGYRIFGKRYAGEVLKVMGREMKKAADYTLPNNLKAFFTPNSFDKAIVSKPNTTVVLKMMCTFEDGHREDVTREATFSSTDFKITNGRVKAGEDGHKGVVTATWTDFTGKLHTVNITIESSGTDELGTRFTSVDQLQGQTFAIVNEEEGKALYGIKEQNLGYDALEKAFVDTNTGYKFKLESCSVSGSYLLRLVTPQGTDYSIWNNPGYLNSQPVDGWCSFILGLDNKNGQDLKNGAVWTLQYVEDKGFSLKNVGTGKYLHDATPAKYDTPVYFTLCNLEPKQRVIDISGNNTSSTYKSYNKAFYISKTDTVDVKMARYCYFSSAISGEGVLNLYAGGERSYLGTANGATWPNWSGYTGNIHVYPFNENSSNAGFWGVVLAHGGKSSSPDNAEADVKSGKVNSSMANNRVTLHRGATICCEANSAGAGFRIGELQTEEGSTLQGYMKNQRSAYYLLGNLNTDFTMAGLIRPSDYRDDTELGIVKEGTGTLRITGNQNYLSGALRVLNGRVLVNNDRAAAETGKLRGGLGARNSDTEAIAYVFEKGVLGGTGSIGGHVDNYGTIEPGNDEVGVLTLQNYTASRATHLFVRPASVLRFKLVDTDHHDLLTVNGSVKYFNQTQDVVVSDKMPVVQLVLDADMTAVVGDEYVLLTAKSKASAAGAWQFGLRQPGRYTWELVESEADGQYVVKARVVSLEDADNPDDPDNPDNPDVPVMGPYYDDGIDDAADTHTLRYYAEKCGKQVGVALCTYKGYDSEREEACRQFGMMVAENEMKMDALQPSRGEFTFGAADALVSLAQSNKMQIRGHCLVWHMQQPGWVSSDGKKNDKNWSRQEALQILKAHINAVMAHFKGKVTEWDVVNECLDDDQSIVRSNPDGYTLRPTVWQRAIGDDYIDSAFVYARRADPNVLLYLNDYDVEYQGKLKSVAFANLAKHLQQRNIPIDGVGLQCHFSVDEVDSAKLDNTFKRFAEQNLKCVITELDMGVKSTTSADYEEQARLYRVVTDIMLHNDNCPYMIIWGIKDNDSWRSASSPLLYDAGMGCKPAWRAVRSALRHQSILTGVAVPMFQSPYLTSPSLVYSLDGRRINTGNIRAGIYIKGGKKYLNINQ